MAPVNAPDLVATFHSIAGIELPWAMHGRDLSLLLSNPEAPWPHPCLYTHTGHHYGSDVAQTLKEHPGETAHNQVPWYMAVVDGGMKFIRYLAPDQPEELYDLKADPEELRNLAADPGRSGDLARLRARLRDEMKRTGADF